MIRALKIHPIFLAGIAVLLAVTHGSAQNPKELKEPLVEESVVRQIPVPVLVWPNNDDPTMCQSFDPKQTLKITVGGKPREIIGFDPTIPEEVATNTEPAVTSASRVRLRLVVLLDYWNMGYGLSCPSNDSGDRQRTAASVFEMLRDMLRTKFQPGDQIMVVRFVGYLKFDTDWISDPNLALAELDRIQADPLPPSIDRGRDINVWLDAMNMLATALGFTPGEKDLLVPVTAVPLDGDHALQLTKYNAVFAQSKVRTHPISIGSGKIFMPTGLRNMAHLTGGHLFEGKDPDLSKTVEQLRSMNRCRVTVYFRPEGNEAKKRFKLNDLHVELLDSRFQLTVAPPTHRMVKNDLTDEEKRQAFFFLKHYEEGVRIEAGLAPNGASGNKGKWRTNVVLRITILNHEVREKITSMVVESIRLNRKLDKQGSVEGLETDGQFARYLNGPEFEKLKRTGSVTLAYPLTATPGLTEIAAMVYTNGIKAQAVTHAEITLPKAPGPYWAIADRMGKMRDDVIIMPMLGSTLPENTQALARGFACVDNPPGFVQAEGPKAKPMFIGTFRQQEPAGREVEAPIFKVECSSQEVATDERCTCLLSFVREPLDPGTWVFVPPASLAPADTSSLQFRVSETQKQVAHK